MADEKTDEKIGPIGRLTRFNVDGLFGGDPVSFDLAADGPTILIGQNGAGKSTILRSINAIGTGDWPLLVGLPFDSIVAEFEDGSSILVASREEGLQVTFGDLSWQFEAGRYEAATVEPPFVAGQRVFRRPRGFEFEGHTYSRGELARLLGIRRLLKEDDAMWVEELSSSLPVLYVTDQRLTIKNTHHPRQARAMQDGPSTVVAVAEFKRELREELSATLRQYATASQSFDEAFPRKVVNAMQEPVALDEVQDLLTRVEKEASSLRKVGLLVEENAPVGFDPRKLDAPEVRPVIKTFAEDTLAKYAVLGPTRAQLEAFTNFLNEHYRGKHIVVHPQSGFQIVLDDNSILHPSQLSSGEQQVMALAFQILFRAEPGTLILIDEPELSLHVLWQRSLIDDLTAMGHARNLSFVLATHSPTIIGDRSDLMRTLDMQGVMHPEQLFPSPDRNDDNSSDDEISSELDEVDSLLEMDDEDPDE